MYFTILIETGCDLVHVWRGADCIHKGADFTAENAGAFSAAVEYIRGQVPSEERSAGALSFSGQPPERRGHEPATIDVGARVRLDELERNTTRWVERVAALEKTVSDLLSFARQLEEINGRLVAVEKVQNEVSTSTIYHRSSIERLRKDVDRCVMWTELEHYRSDHDVKTDTAAKGGDYDKKRELENRRKGDGA